MKSKTQESLTAVGGTLRNEVAAPIPRKAAEVDLHGYHPDEVVGSGVLAQIVKQAWEMGATSLILIHGHGRSRGISPGFVNTNTGYFGLAVRCALRHDDELRQWIKISTLDRSHPGATTVALKRNLEPTRGGFDAEVFPERRYRW